MIVMKKNEKNDIIEPNRDDNDVNNNNNSIPVQIVPNENKIMNSLRVAHYLVKKKGKPLADFSDVVGLVNQVGRKCNV